jgi:hypothetical protein
MPFCAFFERNEKGQLTANLNRFGDEAECKVIVMPDIEYSIYFNNIDSIGWATNDSFPEAGPMTCPAPGGATSEIDYVQVGAIFTFFFGVTLGFWFLAKNLGIVISAIRRF